MELPKRSILSSFHRIAEKYKLFFRYIDLVTKKQNSNTVDFGGKFSKFDEVSRISVRAPSHVWLIIDYQEEIKALLRLFKINNEKKNLHNFMLREKNKTTMNMYSNHIYAVIVPRLFSMRNFQ